MRRPMLPNRWTRRTGVTLIELLMVAGLMTLVIGAVLALQLQGLRIYQSTASADWASFDAGRAVEQLETDIQACFRVTGRYPDRITLSMPAVAWDSHVQAEIPTQPLSEGASVRYYLADAGGVLGSSGTYLWRSVRPAGGALYVRDAAPLARNIVGLQFTYEMAPSRRQASVRYVDVWVRARAKEGGTTTERTHETRILLRNWEFGPITTETGVDEEE